MIQTLKPARNTNKAAKGMVTTLGTANLLYQGSSEGETGCLRDLFH
jgi:hypothetical protein